MTEASIRPAIVARALRLEYLTVGWNVVEGTIGFGGADDHYFLTSIVSPGPQARLQYDPVLVQVPGSDRPLHFVSWAVRVPAAPSKLRFFAGPKDFDVLQKTDPDLVRAIHFGIFAWLVVPLLRALKWVNAYIGNYGWSIIALTVIINLVMFPLRHKSVVSMRKMQELQPEVKAIQDRYAKLKMSDPARQKMNVELMNLYRERGVNPASGCVPMLLTLPVLFAFYSMLSVAIELRGAPFMGWIKDLSTYDPWFVTPILMGLTQFVQQKMTPATGDPAQQRMMMFMPLIFMTMFIWAPSREKTCSSPNITISAVSTNTSKRRTARVRRPRIAPKPSPSASTMRMSRTAVRLLR